MSEVSRKFRWLEQNTDITLRELQEILRKEREEEHDKKD